MTTWLTLINGGIFVAIVTGMLTAFGIWLRYGPERKRAGNERMQIEIDEATRLRLEYTELNKDNRRDIHFLKNELTKVMAEQRDCAKELAEAHAVNRANRDDMRTMMFLLRLLISEVKRLDPDPDNNIIIKQCEAIMVELDSRNPSSIVHPDKNGKSGALKAAEHAVTDAKQTLTSTKEARAEVEASEGEGK